MHMPGIHNLIWILEPSELFTMNMTQQGEKEKKQLHERIQIGQYNNTNSSASTNTLHTPFFVISTIHLKVMTHSANSTLLKYNAIPHS